MKVIILTMHLKIKFTCQVVLLLLVGCDVANNYDSFSYEVCWRRMNLIWKNSASYALEETNHNWDNELLTPAVLIKLGYIKSNPAVVLCPLDQRPFAPFRLLQGPVCPNGHQLGETNNFSLNEYLEWSRRYCGNGTIADLVKGAQSRSVAERRVCSYNTRYFLEKNPGEREQIRIVVKKLAHDDDFLVRSFAMESTDDIKNIREAIGDPVPLVRETAVFRCIELRSSELLPMLMQHLHDTNPRVQVACGLALQRLTGKSFGGDIKKWEKWLENHY